MKIKFLSRQVREKYSIGLIMPKWKPFYYGATKVILNYLGLVLEVSIKITTSYSYKKRPIGVYYIAILSKIAPSRFCVTRNVPLVRRI